MAEHLQINAEASKSEKYEELLPQLEALIADETDLTANLANISAALKTAFDPLWVGFYMVKDNELVLGPFQGPIACTRISFGKGVCGTAWQTGLTQLVPDVDQFPGHIACSSSSRSEIVVPVFFQRQVVMVLDIDSDQLNHFDETDRYYLEKLAEMLASKCL